MTLPNSRPTVGSLELIGTDIDRVERILRDQYRDSVKANNKGYRQRMIIALCDWCGTADWSVVKYRLNL